MTPRRLVFGPQRALSPGGDFWSRVDVQYRCEWRGMAGVGGKWRDIAG